MITRRFKKTTKELPNPGYKSVLCCECVWRVGQLRLVRSKQQQACNRVHTEYPIKDPWESTNLHDAHSPDTLILEELEVELENSLYENLPFFVMKSCKRYWTYFFSMNWVNVKPTGAHLSLDILNKYHRCATFLDSTLVENTELQAQYTVFIGRKNRMYTTLTIEGSEFKARVVPKETVASIWKLLTEKPFPRVTAFQLEDADFDRAIELMRCTEDDIREIQEWGRMLSTEGTDACVFNDDESADFDYIVIIRGNPFHSFGEILRHELIHIVRGDL